MPLFCPFVFCKIEIQTLILLTLTKLATKRFVNLFVDVNKSISEQNKDIQAKKNTPNPISINVFQEFQAIIERISDKQKNRKPKPAVKNYSLSLFLF